MFLKELHIFQFKNIYSASFTFEKNLVFFCGQNGAGKTSILDAIHYLSLTKSFINFTDTDNISFEKDYFQIIGKFYKNGKIEEYSCFVSREGKKRFRYFQKEYQRLYEHIGNVPVIIISPSDQLYILEGSEIRRKLIDSIISQFDKEYLASLIEYNRILKQRNNLLKSEQNIKTKYELIEVLNQQIIDPAKYIYNTRKKFSEELINYLKEFYDILSDQLTEKAELLYKSQLHEQDFSTLLTQNIEKDIATEYSNFGIHKDDFLFNLNHKPIKYFASQGQQKSYITALKLSFVPIIKKYNLTPIILLDDIFDKLDNNRVKNMINLVQESQCQAFLTHTDSKKIDSLFSQNNNNFNLFELNNGNIFKDVIK